MPRGLGAVARAAHRVQPSDSPAHATEQGHPAVGPRAVRMKPRQRYPTAGRALGARTLRRHGSIRPRGGFDHHPPVCRGPALGRSAIVGPWPCGRAPVHIGRGEFNPPSGCQRPCLPRPRGPGARIRDGVSVTRSLADAEGPRPGTRCWVAVAGVSERSEWGRASDEGPRTRSAKQSPHAVARKKTTAPSPRGKKRASRSERQGPGRAPAGQEKTHGVAVSPIERGAFRVNRAVRLAFCCAST